IHVFNEKTFDGKAFYIIANRNGMIKNSNQSLFKTTRFNKTLIATKLKNEDELLNVLRINQEQMINDITHKRLSLTNSTQEL
ncbi:DNA gyrase subunit A, partial [Staphylococcus hominis]